MAGVFSWTGFTGAAVVVVSTFLLWLWRYRWQQRHRLEPKQWPILGAAPEILSNFDQMHDWLLSYFQKGLTSFRMVLPGITYTYTVDPANVEYILKTNFNNFPKGEMYHQTLESLMGDGIFNTDGEVWRQQRKTASFEFASRILRDYSTVTFREHSIMLAKILAKACHTQQPAEMQNLFMRFTLDGICKVGLGVDVGTLSPSLPEVPFATHLDNSNEAVMHRFFDPLWKLKQRLNVGYEAVLARSVKVVDDFTYSIIRTRRAELQVNSAQGKEMKADLLSRFIMLGEDSVQNMSDKTLRDIIFNFIIAGRDTTATTLSWFVYLLGTNPDIADKIYEEVLLLEEGEGPEYVNLPLSEKMKHYASLLSYDVLSKPQYLHAALTETMRLYPAVPQGNALVVGNCAEKLVSTRRADRGHVFLCHSQWQWGITRRKPTARGTENFPDEERLRRVDLLNALIMKNNLPNKSTGNFLNAKGILEDDVLPDGTVLKKGGLVTYVSYAQGRMTNIWGADAFEFRPERFMKDGKFVPENPFKFSAFQAGPRICLGKDSAYLQMKMVMAVLCRFFKFELVPGQQVKYRMMATLVMDKAGVQVMLKER